MQDFSCVHRVSINPLPSAMSVHLVLRCSFSFDQSILLYSDIDYDISEKARSSGHHDHRFQKIPLFLVLSQECSLI